MHTSATALLAYIFRTHRPRIVLTYVLVALEETLGLLYALVIGFTINGLLAGSLTGLWVFMAQYFLHITVSAARSVVDTRTYTRINTELAVETVTEQQRAGVERSVVIARGGLVQEFVEFFESYLPQAIQGVFTVVGALVMLAIFDPVLALAGAGLFVPLVFFNRWFLRLSHRLNRGLNNQYEREVTAVESRDPARIRKHHTLLAFWYVRLSDAEAKNHFAMNLPMLALLGFIIYRSALNPGAQAGDIFAAVSYGSMLTSGLNSVPGLVQQASRLRDISQRMRLEDDQGQPEATEEPGLETARPPHQV